MAVCSVFTGFCVAFKFLSLAFTEHHGLAHLIRRLRPQDLLLLDRGFFSYLAMWLIPQRGAEFLARLSEQMAGFAKRISLRPSLAGFP